MNATLALHALGGGPVFGMPAPPPQREWAQRIRDAIRRTLSHG